MPDFANFVNHPPDWVDNGITDHDHPDHYHHVGHDHPDHPGRDGTHFYGDGCDDDHGGPHINVRLADFEALVTVINDTDRHDFDSTTYLHYVLHAARRLVDNNRSGRPANGNVT